MKNIVRKQSYVWCALNCCWSWPIELAETCSDCILIVFWPTKYLTISMLSLLRWGWVFVRNVGNKTATHAAKRIFVGLILILILLTEIFSYRRLQQAVPYVRRVAVLVQFWRWSLPSASVSTNWVPFRHSCTFPHVQGTSGLFMEQHDKYGHSEGCGSEYQGHFQAAILYKATR